ncbi:MAG: HDOD domain-containing protein [Campylobacterales bacterium]|nr:HDOD domain-containing protein [Campylobacterales bacterium]
MKSSILESIKSLPPLPKTLLDVQRICNDPDASIANLVKVIEPDPMIVANLLKAANSPLYFFGREIRNVSQAVALFGMTMTRSIVLGNSVRKLLNVDMEPYGITSEKFAEISAKQASLMNKWYRKISREKADKLFLTAFLQETGKIIIASDIIQENLTTNFRSEIEMAINIALVERSYVNDTTATVTAAIFEHWNFDKSFVEMIQYADNPASAPDHVREFSTALNIVKTIVPVNAPFGDHAINFGLQKAEQAGYDAAWLEECVNDFFKLPEA